MKVKVNKCFVSGLYEGNPGDLLDLPDPVVKKLGRIGAVDPAPSEAPKKKPARKGGKNGATD